VFVIIADQIGSSGDADRVAGALVELVDRFGDHYPLLPERTAGDELQALTSDAAVALETALHLLRSPHWRVGLGIGAVRMPLPTSVREASGPAFASARAGIEQASRRPGRFAAVGAGGAGARAEHLGALIDLLLTHRARWSPAGWQLHDLIETGLTQAEAAERLGVTPQATSKRARAAGLRVDGEARRALVALLADLGATVEAMTPEGAPA
jgi:predicted XRE-type DNA-binding protein